MGHPVTTNPFIIMLINMTVVFIVLASLSFLIQAIHYFDPTKPKEVEAEPEKPAVPEPVSEPTTAPAVEEGISAETVAVIFAAVAAYGYSDSEIRAVRIVNHENTPWRQSSRFNEHSIHEHHEHHDIHQAHHH